MRALLIGRRNEVGQCSTRERERDDAAEHHEDAHDLFGERRRGDVAVTDGSHSCNSEVKARQIQVSRHFVFEASQPRGAVQVELADDNP